MSDESAGRIADFTEPLGARPGSKVRLGRDFGPREQAGTKKRNGVEPLCGDGELKIFQNMSNEEQRTRFLKRLDLPGKDGNGGWASLRPGGRERRTG
ncbi:hypothetical protein [Streptomyces sp. SLBN-115]|uniref:hypothetical protein n=1 Tax=Streptomyces sp. SLBN-115 TaxID=2768453 RepID=UPI00116B1A60|nr:hypothetical protein [Streptomyces sp. SLBN-115]TQJ47576.1 hypothetical protein FBY34_7008 [Streptomyces sp. SLBN-115]